MESVVNERCSSGRCVLKRRKRKCSWEMQKIIVIKRILMRKKGETTKERCRYLEKMRKSWRAYTFEKEDLMFLLFIQTIMERLPELFPTVRYCILVVH